jgi:hypothetical protein
MWIEEVQKYACFVGGLLFLVLTRNCIAASVTDDYVQTRIRPPSTEVMVARAVAEPTESATERPRRECMAVSIYDERVEDSGQNRLPVALVTFTYTFSEEYPLVVCGLLPRNTA